MTAFIGDSSIGSLREFHAEVDAIRSRSGDPNLATNFTAGFVFLTHQVPMTRLHEGQPFPLGAT
jgi:hypothetical protein